MTAIATSGASSSGRKWSGTVMVANPRSSACRARSTSSARDATELTWVAKRNALAIEARLVDRDQVVGERRGLVDLADRLGDRLGEGLLRRSRVGVLVVDRLAQLVV